MTSPNTGLRRTALVVLAAGATALGASACSSGQVSQTANQVAAVDGGRGSAGELHVNDLQVALSEDGGPARVGLVASYTGYGLGEPVSVDSVVIDGNQVQLDEVAPLERGCTVVFDPRENPAPVEVGEGICIEHAAATLPAADDLALGTSVPATVSFSNGDRIETDAAVVGEVLDVDVYERPAEYAGVPEGH